LRRLSFAAHLEASTSALTTSRYLRLMTMAALQMVWSITVSSYALWFTTMAEPLRPWTTLSDVHSDWNRIDLFPALYTPPFVDKAYYVLWWLVPVSTFGFVAFFAFGKDAMDEYSKFFAWLRVKVFRHSSNAKSSKGTFSIIPLSRSVTFHSFPCLILIHADRAAQNLFRNFLSRTPRVCWTLRCRRPHFQLTLQGKSTKASQILNQMHTPRLRLITPPHCMGGVKQSVHTRTSLALFKRPLQLVPLLLSLLRSQKLNQNLPFHL